MDLNWKWFFNIGSQTRTPATFDHQTMADSLLSFLNININQNGKGKSIIILWAISESHHLCFVWKLNLKKLVKFSFHTNHTWCDLDRFWQQEWTTKRGRGGQKFRKKCGRSLFTTPIVINISIYQRNRYPYKLFKT